MENRPRLSTGQVAKLLKVRHGEALALLKAAKINYVRLGNVGCFLWDADAVNTLVIALTAGGEAKP
jgi:hypothetical protein